MQEKIVTAEELAKEFREISVAEFFERNRHFLGYENPTKSLLTACKEAVDNALEFTCEAGILPEVRVKLKQVSPERFRLLVEDNGPGVVAAQVPKAFGRVLYGSRFHKLKQSRSLFGIGIKGALLYSQLTTGKPAKVTTATGKSPIHTFSLMIDVAKNEPIVLAHETKTNPQAWHGLRIELELEGRYVERVQSIPEYLKQTAMANPYARIIFEGPNGKLVFERSVEQLPPRPKEIKPHPYGVELGILRRMISTTKAKTILSFLTSDFSRVGKGTAKQICKLARIALSKKPSELTPLEEEKLHKAMQTVKISAPPTDCLSPLGETLLEQGLKKEVEPEYVVAVTRTPSIYRGMPFQVEVCLGYGGKLPPEQALLFRFANKVPLLYHQSECALTQAAREVDWRRYGFSQSEGQLPSGPLAILLHFASVWIPFTSEGKQAIASYPEILKEAKLALQEAGRKLGAYVKRKIKLREAQLRKSLFEAYIPEFAESLSKLAEVEKETIKSRLQEMIRKGQDEKG